MGGGLFDNRVSSLALAKCLTIKLEESMLDCCSQLKWGEMPEEVNEFHRKSSFYSK